MLTQHTPTPLLTHEGALIIEWPKGQNNCGFHVAKVISQFVRDDAQAEQYAALIVKAVNERAEHLALLQEVIEVPTEGWSLVDGLALHNKIRAALAKKLKPN